ncbi:MAG: hypothetical protein ACP5HK_01280 [Acidilobus sp.]
MRKGALGLAATTAAMRFSTAILQAATPLLLASSGLRLFGVASLTVILWAAVTVGSLLASLIKRPWIVSVTGLIAMSVGLLILYLSTGLALLAIPLAGLGAGLASSVLAPMLHAMSSRERPFEGVASYSFSLSIGLIAAMAFTSVAAVKDLPIAFLGSSTVAAAIAAIILIYRVEEPPLKVEIPTLSDVKRLFSEAGFTKAFASNFTYSVVFPFVLSYWALYATRVLGLGADIAFALLSAMFLFSGAVRGLSVGFSDTKTAHKVAEILLVISVALLASKNQALAVAGLLLFAIPHSLIYPTTLYTALSSGPHHIKANYLYSASSGAGEVLSPIVAAVTIAKAGLGPLYLVAIPLALASLLSSVL